MKHKHIKIYEDYISDLALNQELPEIEGTYKHLDDPDYDEDVLDVDEISDEEAEDDTNKYYDEEKEEWKNKRMVKRANWFEFLAQLRDANYDGAFKIGTKFSIVEKLDSDALEGYESAFDAFCDKYNLTNIYNVYIDAETDEKEEIAKKIYDKVKKIITEQINVQG